MKYAKKGIMLRMVFVLLMLLGIHGRAMGFSSPVEDFIRNEHQVEFVLFSEDEITFSPRVNLSIPEVRSLEHVYDGGKESDFSLAKNNTYTVKPLKEGFTYWAVQFFASESRQNVLDIKEELAAEGFHNTFVVQEDRLYKLKGGPFLNRQIAEKNAANISQKGWNLWTYEQTVSSGDRMIGIFDKQGNLLTAGWNLSFEGIIGKDNNYYSGEFCFSHNDGKTEVKNKVGIDEMILGQLEYRLARHRIYNKKEVFQMAAIIYRSKILNQITANPPRKIRLNDYHGYSGGLEQAEKAVRKTRGQVLKKDDKFLDLSSDIYSILRDVLRKNDFSEVLGDIDSSYKLVDLSEKVTQEVIFETEVKTGLNYKSVQGLSWYGPQAFSVMEIDMSNSAFEIEPVLAQNQFDKREKLLDMVLREQALAGVNGGYFDYRGYPLGLMVKNGEMISGPLYDRTSLAITEDGEVIIERLEWEGNINDQFLLSGVNREPGENEIILFNEYFGPETPEINKEGLVAIIEEDKITEIFQGKLDIGVPIPQNGKVILATGEKTKDIFSVLTDEIEINNHFFKYDGGQKINAVSALSAGPRLLKGGEVYITGEEENFRNDILKGRSPRSAVGLKEDNKLIFITVDGRQPKYSIGISLEGLAKLLREMGVKEAMNLDGGGSAGMVIRKILINNPLEERLLGNSLIIK
ncbi:MAG: phosphodiester glycosidase family protein [Halanaerobiaceae bacterium]